MVAEGIFAHHVVGQLREAGLLAAAYCLRQHPMVTFWRRLSRDLREHRKPPLVLLRRGIALMRDQRRIVAEAVAAGCTAVSADQAMPWSSSCRCRGDTRWTSTPSAVSPSPTSAPAGPARWWPRASSSTRRTPPPRTRTPSPAPVLDLHRQLTGASAFGRAQLPWPRALGTPPWAVARAMSEFSGVHYSRRRAVPRSRAKLFTRLSDAVAERPAPFYVGDWIPRHVVLAVGPTAEGVQVYNPAHGTLVEMTRADFEAGKLTTFGRWTRPWFVVLPD